MLKNKEFRIYILITSLIFSFAILSGYSEAINSPMQSRIFVESFFSNLDFTKNLNPFLIFVFIFLNNILKAFFVVVFGFFFAIVPLVFIYTNGELVGLVVGVFQQENGLFGIVLGLLPHGILEVPAMILATSYGIWLGNCFYRRLRYRELFRVKLFFALKKFVRVIFPLIFSAAVVETFVTPLVINYLFSR